MRAGDSDEIDAELVQSPESASQVRAGSMLRQVHPENAGDVIAECGAAVNDHVGKKSLGAQGEYDDLPAEVELKPADQVDASAGILMSIGRCERERRGKGVGIHAYSRVAPSWDLATQPSPGIPVRLHASPDLSKPASVVIESCPIRRCPCPQT